MLHKKTVLISLSTFFFVTLLLLVLFYLFFNNTSDKDLIKNTTFESSEELFVPIVLTSHRAFDDSKQVTVTVVTDKEYVFDLGEPLDQTAGTRREPFLNTRVANISDTKDLLYFKQVSNPGTAGAEEINNLLLIDRETGLVKKVHDVWRDPQYPQNVDPKIPTDIALLQHERVIEETEPLRLFVLNKEYYEANLGRNIDIGWLDANHFFIIDFPDELTSDTKVASALASKSGIDETVLLRYPVFWNEDDSIIVHVYNAEDLSKSSFYIKDFFFPNTLGYIDENTISYVPYSDSPELVRFNKVDNSREVISNVASEFILRSNYLIAADSPYAESLELDFKRDGFVPSKIFIERAPGSKAKYFAINQDGEVLDIDVEKSALKKVHDLKKSSFYGEKIEIGGSKQFAYTDVTGIELFESVDTSTLFIGEPGKTLKIESQPDTTVASVHTIPFVSPEPLNIRIAKFLKNLEEGFPQIVFDGVYGRHGLQYRVEGQPDILLKNNQEQNYVTIDSENTSELVWNDTHVLVLESPESYRHGVRHISDNVWYQIHPQSTLKVFLRDTGEEVWSGSPSRAVWGRPVLLPEGKILFSVTATGEVDECRFVICENLYFKPTDLELPKREYHLIDFEKTTPGYLALNSDTHIASTQGIEFGQIYEPKEGSAFFVTDKELYRVTVSKGNDTPEIRSIPLGKVVKRQEEFNFYKNFLLLQTYDSQTTEGVDVSEILVLDIYTELSNIIKREGERACNLTLFVRDSATSLEGGYHTTPVQNHYLAERNREYKVGCTRWYKETGDEKIIWPFVEKDDLLSLTEDPYVGNPYLSLDR